jgi:RNA polymerase sigma-70 factor (ECF subfamily)
MIRRRSNDSPAVAGETASRMGGMSIQASVADSVDELQRALADDAGFESWYRRTLPRVYAYLVSRSGGDVALAEDLTQQTFIAAIDQRSRYDGRSDTVTWLCGIARHKLADHFRALERDERRQMRMQVQQIELDSGARAELDLGDRALIAEVLRSLPASQRAVLVFVVLDDLPVAEAARLLGKSRGATESLLFRARDSFRRAYGAEDRDD